MNSVEVELNCQHHVRLSVSSHKGEGDDAYCRFHGYQRITKVWPDEWRVICPECTFGRWCGQRESNAKRIASRHKHRAATYVYDTITASGGTPRKVLLKRLTTVAPASKFDPNEPIPF